MKSNETHNQDAEVLCSSCGMVAEQQEALLLGITDVAEELVEMWICKACLEGEEHQP